MLSLKEYKEAETQLLSLVSYENPNFSVCVESLEELLEKTTWADGTRQAAKFNVCQQVCIQWWQLLSKNVQDTTVLFEMFILLPPVSCIKDRILRPNSTLHKYQVELIAILSGVIVCSGLQSMVKPERR